MGFENRNRETMQRIDRAANVMGCLVPAVMAIVATVAAMWFVLRGV